MVLVSVEVTGLCCSRLSKEDKMSDPSPKFAVGDFIRFTGPNLYDAEVGEMCEILSVESHDSKKYSYGFNMGRHVYNTPTGYYAIYDGYPGHWRNVELASFCRSPLWKLMNGEE